MAAAERAELARASGDPASVARLQGQVALLVARARTEDGTAERRRRAEDRIRIALRADGAAGRTDAETSVAELASALLESAAAETDGAPDGSDQLRDLLRIYIGTDIPDAVQVRGRADGEGDASINTLGTVEAASLSIDEVQGYLRRHTGDSVLVTQVTRLAGGFGKETILVCTDGPAGPGEIVLRKVVPGRPADILAPEFGMVRFAWQHGLPVPEPLWIEMDPSELGSPFFVTSRCGGRNAGDVYGPYPGVSSTVAVDVATIVARLHALDVDDLEPAPTVPMHTSAQVTDAIANQENLLAGVAGPDDPYGPLWRAVLAWLRSHLPQPGERPTLVHADVGFHNLLIADGHVEALLDWERAHLGTVAQDLAYIRPSIRNLMAWDDFLAAYCKEGGSKPDEASLLFYTVWQDTWRGIASLRLRQRFLTEATPRLSDGIAGLMMAPRFLLTAVQNAFGVELLRPD